MALKPKEPIILVVEDDSDTAQMLCYVLKSIGFVKIIQAKDGIDALPRLKMKGVSCIICDWHMPRMSGLDLFKHMKADMKLRKIPFLMVTTESHQEKVIEAMSAGVSDYVLKPFNGVILENKMKKLLGPRFPVKEKNSPGC